MNVLKPLHTERKGSFSHLDHLSCMSLMSSNEFDTLVLKCNKTQFSVFSDVRRVCSAQTTASNRPSSFLTQRLK